MSPHRRSELDKLKTNDDLERATRARRIIGAMEALSRAVPEAFELEGPQEYLRGREALAEGRSVRRSAPAAEPHDGGGGETLGANPPADQRSFFAEWPPPRSSVGNRRGFRPTTTASRPTGPSPAAPAP